MVRPERRTTADLVTAAAIAVTVVIAGVLTWWSSDARATSSRPADEPAAKPASARTVPAALTQLWTAESPATDEPVVISGTVVTGDGRQMTGRDLTSGEPRWSYTRNADLCAVSWIYRYALAVYPDSRGCGQVSAIDANTGRRGPARTGYADRDVTVTSDGTAVLSVGSSRLELWRSDLVRVLAYGEIDARVKPSARGIGQGCTLLSAAGDASAVSVLESCPGQQDTRLTLLRSAKEDDEPDLHYVPQSDLPAALAADSGARVLAVVQTDGGTSTAVYLPAPRPRVEVVDETGATTATTLLPAPASSRAAHLPVSRAADLISWWTGDAVVMFDAETLAYRYTVPGVGAAVPVGPAASMADRLLIPVSGGVGVYDPRTGTLERTIPVSRAPGVSTVFPAVAGKLVLEQRGQTVVALR